MAENLLTDGLALSRVLALGSVGIYLVFDFLDRKRVKDEREEWIRLKAYEFTGTLSTWALTAAAVLLWFRPDLPAFYAVTGIILATMYGEILGKIYYRRKL